MFVTLKIVMRLEKNCVAFKKIYTIIKNVLTMKKFIYEKNAC